jgi:hypothetical protein
VSDRLYTEAEVQALLRQAAERQQRLGPSSSAHGLTLAEVEAIAAEAGLDPAHVRAAARSGVEPETKRWLGAPKKVRRSRHIDGPLTDEAWVRTVEDLRRTFEQDGAATQLGPVREWKADKEGNDRLLVSAEPEGDGYLLSMEQDYSKSLHGLLGGAIGMGATPLILLTVMLGTGNPEMLPIIFVLFAATLAFVLIPPPLYKRKGEEQLERFDALLDRAERAALQTKVETLSAPAKPALDLDALGNAPADEQVAARRRTRS